MRNEFRIQHPAVCLYNVLSWVLYKANSKQGKISTRLAYGSIALCRMIRWDVPSGTGTFFSSLLPHILRSTSLGHPRGSGVPSGIQRQRTAAPRY